MKKLSEAQPVHKKPAVSLIDNYHIMRSAQSQSYVLGIMGAQTTETSKCFQKRRPEAWRLAQTPGSNFLKKSGRTQTDFFKGNIWYRL